jgi:hypothetical protein
MEPSSIYKINDKGFQFILDNNPDLKNNISSLNQSTILDKFFFTLEKKLISESSEFKSIRGNSHSIVFGSQTMVGVGGYRGCGEVGILGSFQTDSNEKYKIIFEMDQDYVYTFILYPDLGNPTNSKLPVQYLIITEVELSSKNGTQWARIYNPTAYDIPLESVYLADSKVSRAFVSFEKNSTLKSGHDTIVQIPYSSQPFSNWSNMQNSIILYPIEEITSYDPIIIDPTNGTNMYWDKTPSLNDYFSDSRTWQYNGTSWIFTDKHIAIPEFPFAQIMLVFGIVSVAVIYRIRK